MVFKLKRLLQTLRIKKHDKNSIQTKLTKIDFIFNVNKIKC